MIAIIDYGMGNLRSVQKALERLGAEVDIISDVERLSLSNKIILPGVGAFKDTIDGIDSRGLKDVICEFIDSGKPYLGICMGLQVIFEESCNTGMHLRKRRFRCYLTEKFRTFHTMPRLLINIALHL